MLEAPTLDLAKKLIDTQFPKYSHLSITEVKDQGHDNVTYRLGDKLLIRIPTTEIYAQKVSIEQEFLPKLAPYLHTNIPTPIGMGSPSKDYPLPFSIYEWIDGESANHVDSDNLNNIAIELATFLKELQSVDLNGPMPGQHNWWRGDHLSVYDEDARKQISNLATTIDSNACLSLWEKACNTQWQHPPVWIHGDLSSGNIIIKDNQLHGIIDFGCMGMGDPACDLVIAWTYLPKEASNIFINSLSLDDDTWLRAKGWALWKATYELCQMKDHNTSKAKTQKDIIHKLLINFLP